MLRAASIAWAAALFLVVPRAADAQPIPIHAVVVTTFEIGRDTGDVPGEFQYWVERLPLRETLPFPLGVHPLRYNERLGVLGLVTGEGAERGAASIMALGTDPRFDLSHAYWVVAGIAGVDPAVASLGSAAWANWVINADLGYEVDARDKPSAWTTGIVPFDRTAPYAPPAPPATTMHGQMAYRLNPALVAWAYRRTAAVALADTAALRALRATYHDFPAAQRPPFVLIGDSLCGDRFWIGPAMNAWAERWVAYWTGGRGRYAMTAEEDAGILQSLTLLAHGGRVDRERVLVLRTASDFDEPAPAHSDIRPLLASDNGTGLSAYAESLEAAYRVGSPVVRELAAHWERYRSHVP